MVCTRRADSSKNILWIQWISAIGAMLMMLTLGLSFGWTSPFLAKLLAEDSPIPITTNQASWVASLLNLGRIFGGLLGGISVQYVGSKWTLVLTGFPVMTCWICFILANSVIWIYVGRFASGMSVGMSFSSLPLYLGEISSPTMRGTFVSLAMTGPALGTLLGNAIGVYVSITNFAYISLVPNVIFILLFVWFPNTPYYLVSLGRLEDAKKSIAWYDPSKDTKVEIESLTEFVASLSSQTFVDRLREFNRPQNRMAILIAMALYFFMQFSGMNSVMFYLQIILSNVGVTVVRPAMAVYLIGIVGVLAGWISVYVADKFKRKTLMIFSSVGVGLSMLVLGLNFVLLKYGHDPEKLQWIAIVSVATFQFSLCSGLIAVPSMIVSELFAPNIKNILACFASVSCALFAFTATKIYQPLVDAIGYAWVFWIHAILMLISAIFSGVYLPETKGKSLQEIQNSLTTK